jgi:hypothetical protein
LVGLGKLELSRGGRCSPLNFSREVWERLPLVSYVGNRSIANANQQLLTRSKLAYDCEDDIADEINSGRRPEATIQSLVDGKGMLGFLFSWLH